MVQGKCTCRAIEVASRSLLDDLKINSPKSPKKFSVFKKCENDLGTYSKYLVNFFRKKFEINQGDRNGVFNENVHVPFECHVQVNSIFIGGLQVKLVQVYCIYLNFVLQR